MRDAHTCSVRSWSYPKSVVGIARNAVLQRLGESLSEEASARYEETGQHQKLFSAFRYAAKTWDFERVL